MTLTETHSAVRFERILFATDLCPRTATAATYAAGLARRFSSTLELAHVIDLSITTPAIDVVMEPALEAIRHSGEEGLRELATSLPGVQVKKTVVEGFLPADLILGAAASGRSDVIVLGTSSKHGLKKLALGSTAEEVIRKATCPVMTVGPHVPKAPAGPLSFKRIVYATDFSSAARKAARYALTLAEDLEADLYLCHVVSAEEASTRYAPTALSAYSLKRLVPESGYDRCQAHCVVEHGNAVQAILGLAGRVHADLIVLGARRPSFWLTYVHPGVTPALLAEAKCPVLTVC